MKLLLDQNISHRLARRVSDLYPGSTHTRYVGMQEALDSAIWDYASNNGFMIVTKDSDFQARSIIDGHPPKVIWITRGNCTTDDIESILRHNHQAIIAFQSNPTKSLITLD